MPGRKLVNVYRFTGKSTRTGETGDAGLKLNNRQIKEIRDQFGIDPIPERSPLIAGFTLIFGDHSFYVDPNGLFVWEPQEASDSGGLSVRATRIADWTDSTMTRLNPHPDTPAHSNTVAKLSPS